MEHTPPSPCVVKRTTQRRRPVLHEAHAVHLPRNTGSGAHIGSPTQWAAGGLWLVASSIILLLKQLLKRAQTGTSQMLCRELKGHMSKRTSWLPNSYVIRVYKELVNHIYDHLCASLLHLVRSKLAF